MHLRLLLPFLTVVSVSSLRTSHAETTLLEPSALRAATFRTDPAIAKEIPTPNNDPKHPVTRTIQINGRGQDFYVTQLLLPIDATINEADTLLLTFDARTTAVRDETGQGLLTTFFQNSGPPWSKSLLRPIPLTPEWTTYQFPFRAGRDFEPDKLPSELGFGFGGREQTVDIANVRLVNHGPDVAPDSLPQTRATYKGREADAAWRTAADERIDAIRKAPLTVKVADRNGAPIPGARVTVAQQRHTFLFGTAVSVPLLNTHSPDAERYRKTLLELFNHVGIENALKWPSWTGEWKQSGDGTIEDALQWLKDQNFHIRGHVLVWPSFRNMPKFVEKLKDHPEQLRATIANRVTGAVKDYRAYIDEWDVINEPFDNHDVMDILGNEVMAEWFRLARQTDPKPRFSINDYGILAGGDANNSPHRQHFEDTISTLLKEGAPLEGIGLQSHFGEHLTPPDAVLTILDRFARLGLPMQVTEFDIDTTDEQLQADYTRDFMTVIFSHPQIDGFTMWGFWQGKHWRPAAAMYRRDWTAKPNAKVYKDLVFQTWWTNESGTTSTTGEFTTRAFLGEYKITVEHNDRTEVKSLTLTPDSGGTSVKLPSKGGKD